MILQRDANQNFTLDNFKNLKDKKMEMDWGTAFIGLVMILICIIPFVVMHYNREKKEHNTFQMLSESAKAHHCIISQHEFCGDFVLGIDESRNFVFFIKQRKSEVISQFVDLAEIQTCKVDKKTINLKNDSGSFGIIDRVELSFTPTNNSKTKTTFELYAEEVNMQLSGELQLAEKWSKKINDCLKNKR